MTAPSIEVRGLTISYGPRRVLRPVDLTVAPGEVTAVVGPSGCGKTSFLHALNRLHDLTASAAVTGSVRIGALDVLSAATDVLALRKTVGLIFQRPNPFPMSVYRNVAMPLEHHGRRDGSVRAKVEEALRDVGLWDEVRDGLDRPAGTLSGGQQQRLCIARALALGPSVLLMDEPCSALDPVATATIEGLVRSLRGRLTVVVVTHNLAQARRVSDSVACFWSEAGEGRLLEHGPTEAMFTAPGVAAVRDYLAGKVG